MMAPMSAKDLAAVTEGSWTGLGEAGGSWQKVSTDSRQCDEQTLFVALKGERFDAHDFLSQVAESGAAAVVSKATAASLPQLSVADTQVALADIASLNRARLPVAAARPVARK